MAETSIDEAEQWFPKSKIVDVETHILTSFLVFCDLHRVKSGFRYYRLFMSLKSLCRKEKSMVNPPDLGRIGVLKLAGPDLSLRISVLSRVDCELVD